MRHICIILGKWLVVAAMITAIGGHWMVLQSVAWTTMVIVNVENEKIGEALQNTFDGEHPCDLCRSIEKARQSEHKKESPAAVNKIDLFHERVAVKLSQPLHFWYLQSQDIFARNFPRPPILQPPRGSLS